MKTVIFDLTDAEWMSLIDGSEERDGLMVCCGNISGLRDRIISFARNARGPQYEWEFIHFARALGAAEDGHNLDIPALNKLRAQLDIEDQVQHVRDAYSE